MFIIKVHTFWLLPVLMLTGCATFYAHQSYVSRQIDTWLLENRYDKALDTIAALSPEHSDYPSLINSVAAIEKQRQTYIQAILKEAGEFGKRQDWVNAEKTLESGLKLIPKTPEFEAQQIYYAQKRLDRIHKDRSAILISKARYLITARPHQESLLYNADSAFFGQQQFSAFLKEAKLVSRELYVLGHQYWQEKKYVQAREALTLSVSTAQNELSSELLNSILKTERQNREIARKKKLKLASEQVPELEKIFHERMSSDDFISAQEILNELVALDITNIEEMQLNLNRRKALKVEQLIASGNTLYNSGYLQEAIDRWTEAKILNPDNPTIQQQLERANTFLNNLERWQSGN